MKSKRKAIKDLTQSKIVNISDYRDLRTGRESRALAFVTEKPADFQTLNKDLPEGMQFEFFDSRFSFEQSMKNKEWAAVFLDERSLKDDALQICEKLKRQNKMEELIVFVLSNSGDKNLIRRGFEKGCDEWITKIDDSQGMIRLLGHHLDF